MPFQETYENVPANSRDALRPELKSVASLAKWSAVHNTSGANPSVDFGPIPTNNASATLILIYVKSIVLGTMCALSSYWSLNKSRACCFNRMLHRITIN